MKPVTQSHQSITRGDCFAASVASILELGLDRVPDSGDSGSERHWEIWNAWGAENNCYFMHFDAHRAWSPKGYVAATVIAGKRTEEWDGQDVVRHCVVFKDGEFVHDPFPGAVRQWTSADAEFWVVIVPLDPSRPIGRVVAQ